MTVRRHKQLMDNLKEMRQYCKLKEDTLDHTLMRPLFERGYGSVVAQTTESVTE